MANKEIRTKVTIGKTNYDVMYKSLFTGNVGTAEDLLKGKYHEEDKKSPIEPVALRERTAKHDRRLILDPDGWEKPRCPYCFNIKITEYANKRDTWELGKNIPVNSAKVDFGISRNPRRREVAKYCDSCDRVFVKEKVVVAKY